MATILRGPLKGRKVEVLQWCNDWCSVRPGGIVSITNLKFAPADIDLIKKHKHNGILFGLFELRPDNTFRRRKFKDGKLQ